MCLWMWNHNHRFPAPQPDTSSATLDTSPAEHLPDPDERTIPTASPVVSESEHIEFETEAPKRYPTRDRRPPQRYEENLYITSDPGTRNLQGSHVTGFEGAPVR
ncbi:hypothetical protein ACJJTC_010044 [Scirpophaga incertulas]